MNEMIVDEELTSPVSKSRALDRWERPPGQVYPDEEDGNSTTDFGYSSGLGRSQESLDQRRYPLRRSLLEDSRRQTSKNGTAWGEDDIARNRDPVEFRDDKETEDDRLFAEFSTLTSNSWKTLPKQLSDAGTTSLRFGFATDRSHGSTASSSSVHSQKGLLGNGEKGRSNIYMMQSGDHTSGSLREYENPIIEGADEWTAFGSGSSNRLRIESRDSSTSADRPLLSLKSNLDADKNGFPPNSQLLDVPHEISSQIESINAHQNDESSEAILDTADEQVNLFPPRTISAVLNDLYAKRRDLLAKGNWAAMTRASAIPAGSEQMYVPFEAARKTIEHIVEDCNRVRDHYATVVESIDQHYKEIENETRKYFTKVLRDFRIREKGKLEKARDTVLKAKEERQRLLGERDLARQELSSTKKDFQQTKKALEDALKRNSGLQSSLATEAQNREMDIFSLREVLETDLAKEEERNAALTVELTEVKMELNKLKVATEALQRKANQSDLELKATKSASFCGSLIERGDSEETIARLHSQIERIRQEHQVQLDKLILQHHSDLAEVRKREEDIRLQVEHLLSGEAPSRVFRMEDSTADEGRESADPQDESRSSDLPKKEAMTAYVSTLSQQIRDAQACTDELRALLESKDIAQFHLQDRFSSVEADLSASQTSLGIEKRRNENLRSELDTLTNRLRVLEKDNEYLSSRMQTLELELFDASEQKQKIETELREEKDRFRSFLTSHSAAAVGSTTLVEDVTKFSGDIVSGEPDHKNPDELGGVKSIYLKEFARLEIDEHVQKAVEEERCKWELRLRNLEEDILRIRSSSEMGAPPHIPLTSNLSSSHISNQSSSLYDVHRRNNRKLAGQIDTSLEHTRRSSWDSDSEEEWAMTIPKSAERLVLSKETPAKKLSSSNEQHPVPLGIQSPSSSVNRSDVLDSLEGMKTRGSFSIMKIDNSNEQRDLSDSEGRLLRSNLDDHFDVLVSENAVLKQRLDEALTWQESLILAQDEKRILEEELARLRENYTRVSSSYESVMDELTAVSAARNVAEDKLSSMSSTFDSLAANEKQVAELRSILDDVTRERDEKNDLVAELEERADQLEEISIQAAEYQEQLVQLRKELSEIRQGYDKVNAQRRAYYNELEDIKGGIRVYCRVRPFLSREIAAGASMILTFPDDYSLHLLDEDRSSGASFREFEFDRVFKPDEGQNVVFEDVKRLVQSALDGYNVCVFAYGQTGSGKTHTMSGSLEDPELSGIAPRAIHEIFARVAENSDLTATITCNMIELYLDNLVDLFAESGKPPKLSISKDIDDRVRVKNAVTLPAANEEDLLRLYCVGLDHRKKAETRMNSSSSRSHLLFMIWLEVFNKRANRKLIGKLTLVDLAGSERLSRSGVTDKTAIKEATTINQSLSALQNVISFLSDPERDPNRKPPYRDNKLTMLMQDSIGGNSKTLMFVNISPASDSTIETKNSLQYAKRVKRIHNNTEKVTETKRTLKLQSMARERTALLWSAYFSVTSGLIVPGDPSSLDPMIVELFQDADPEYFRRMLQESRAERALQTESDELFPSSTNADLALMDGDAELSTPTRDSFPGVASTSFS